MLHSPRERVSSLLSGFMHELLSPKIRIIAITTLLIVWLIIAITNLSPDTYFSGWDNLHPEFNIGLSLKRAVFGVWQEHQGTGHVGGHGYASTLPHTLMIGALLIVVPEIQVRLLFTLIMLLTGGLGAFTLISYLLKQSSHNKRYLLALIGGLFYMVNFATVQQFYVQLEAFIIHFAFLPWLLYLVLSLLESWKKRTLIIFALLSFLSSTQGFVPPLFIIYFISLSVILFSYLLSSKTKRDISRVFIIFAVTLCVNTYWLLPVIHYTTTQSQVFLNATNNVLSTQGWIDTNSKYGTFADLSILKGFPSQALDEAQEPGLQYIFQPWINHFSNPLIQIFGYVLFAIVIIGIIGFSLRHKPQYRHAFVIIFLITFSLLATQIPVFSVVSTIMQKLPIFKQAFRAGFTKVSITLALMYSIFLAYGVGILMAELEKRLRNKNIGKLIFCGTFVMIVIFSLPIFQGNLFYRKAHLSIPKAYFELFSFFNKQDPDERIALLPQGNHWGWDTYRWGYTGSGFLWFGLQQPILERAFDVWSNHNENYYWELSNALYSLDKTSIENITKKYEIHWILFDESMIPYTDSKSAIQADKIRQLLSEIDTFQEIKKIPISNSNRNLFIYKVNNTFTDKNHVKIAKNLVSTSGDFRWKYKDNSFGLTNGYYSELNYQNSLNHIYFPFESLFTYRRQKELDFQTTVTTDKVTFTAIVPSEFNTLYTKIPTYPFNEMGLEPVSVDDTLIPEPIEIQVNSVPVISLKPDQTGETSFTIYNAENTKYEVTIPKEHTPSSFDSKTDAVKPNIVTCSDDKKGISKSQEIYKENGEIQYRLENQRSTNCYDLFLSNLSHKYGYLLTIDINHEAGNPLLASLINATTQRTDMEVLLPDEVGKKTIHLIIPPKVDDGLGYSLRLANISLANRDTKNIIGRVQFIPIPYKFLSSFYFSTSQDGSVVQPNFTSHYTIQHDSSYFYEVELDRKAVENKSILVVDQGYDSGWKAYTVDQTNWLEKNAPFIFGQELKDHVLVNNWANGWKLNNEAMQQSNNIIIIFWPQYLEYLGFVFLILIFIFVLKYKNRP